MAEQLPDSGKRSEFETGAVRDASEGKGFPSLLPPDALRAASKRFEDGALKYGRNNWQKGIPLSRYVDSLYRHLWALQEGQTDEDHGGAVIWNAMCLVQTKVWIEQGKLPETLYDLVKEEPDEKQDSEAPEEGREKGHPVGGIRPSGQCSEYSVGEEIQGHEEAIKRCVKAREEETARRGEAVSE